MGRARSGVLFRRSDGSAIHFQGTNRMTARKLISRPAKGLTAAIAALLLVAAMEYQLFSYAASVFRHEFRAMTGATTSETGPSEILAAHLGDDRMRLRFLAAGDIARCARTDLPGRLLPATSEQLGLRGTMVPKNSDPASSAKLAALWPGLPVLAIGDLVYRRGTPGEFSECYDVAWGRLRDRILPAPGNHEYGSPGAFGYFDYWGAQAGPDRRGYYALHWRNWLMLSLNSEVEAGPGSPQSLWLAQELENAPGACVMAFFHKPAHSLQGPRRHMKNGEMLFAQVQKAGGSFVLNGHNHFYERTLPLDSTGTIDPQRGTIGFTVGTGGIESPTSPQAALPAETAAAIFGTIGLLRMELSDEGFAWWFHRASDAEVMDQGQAPCLRRGPAI
jgi:acid phosphatase type 7